MPWRMLAPAPILALCLLTLMVIIGVWDVWAAATNRPADTVSNIIGTWSRAYPMLPLLVGVLLGHLFWPRQILPLSLGS